eukprot:3097780-Rhodomonas_salina.1
MSGTTKLAYAATYPPACGAVLTSRVVLSFYVLEMRCTVLLATQCPVLRKRTGVPIPAVCCYGMCGTEIGYAATGDVTGWEGRDLRAVTREREVTLPELAQTIFLRFYNAMFGTERARSRFPYC